MIVSCAILIVPSRLGRADVLAFMPVFSAVLIEYEFRRKNQIIEVETA